MRQGPGWHVICHDIIHAFRSLEKCNCVEVLDSSYDETVYVVLRNWLSDDIIYAGCLGNENDVQYFFRMDDEHDRVCVYLSPGYDEG